MSVINKVSEASCCGCGACVAVCQRHCLQMKQDNNGWFRPLLSLRACNECGLCESVCPVLAPKTLREQSENVFAAKAKSKSIRIKSSSGGVFATLANHIIEQQGIVCAARFASPTRLIHDFCSKKEDLPGYMGSKYLQSDMSDCYLKTKNYLLQGVKVLFVGTPCQVMALKLYLKKTYPELITMEIVCHGVPSQKAWQNYLEAICRRTKTKPESITGIEFRNKDRSWSEYSMKISTPKGSIHRKTRRNDLFLKAFQSNLLQRDCCFSCPAKSVETKSDIVAGDYWGVDNFHRDIADDRGVSCLIVRNKSLLQLIKSLPLELTATKYEYIAASNPAIERSARPNPKREQYLQSLACKDFIEATKPLVQTPLSQKTRLAINNFKHSLLILLQRIKPYR